MTPLPDQPAPETETPDTRKIAEGIVNQIAIGAWQFCSPGWVTSMIEEALRNERESQRGCEHCSCTCDNCAPCGPSGKDGNKCER